MESNERGFMAWLLDNNDEEYVTDRLRWENSQREKFLNELNAEQLVALSDISGLELGRGMRAKLGILDDCWWITPEEVMECYNRVFGTKEILQ